MSILNTFRLLERYQSLLGYGGLIEFLWKTKIRKNGSMIVNLPGLKHPVELRMGTSDTWVAIQICLQSEYRFNLDRPPRNLIDVGANVGISTGYFATMFPDTKIVALEPEEGNFRQLQKNTAPYPNVTAVNAALWDSDGTVNIADPGLHEWGFQTKRKDTQNSDGAVRSVTVSSLMAEHGLEDIDILKIDIEGAEVEVFAASAPWIDHVGLLVVELHDGERMGSSRTFYNATNNFDDEWRIGENVYLVNRRIVKERQTA